MPRPLLEDDARLAHEAEAAEAVEASRRVADAARALHRETGRFLAAMRASGLAIRVTAPAPARGHDWGALIDTADDFRAVPALEADDFVAPDDYDAGETFGPRVRMAEAAR